MTPEELLGSQKWRYAVKIFDAAKKIPAASWSALEECLVLSPSSYGLQPWKFFVVRDPETRAKLRDVSWKQSQVTDASHYVVFAGRVDVTPEDVDRYIRRTSEVTGKPVDSLKRYRDLMIGDVVTGPRHAWLHEWVSRQVYIALGNFMTSAAVLGIDTCPMEGLDPDRYDEILGLKALGYSTRVACAAGYRSADDKYALVPKVRYPADELIARV